MYFVVIGRQKELALAELRTHFQVGVSYPGGHLIGIKTDLKDSTVEKRLSLLGGVVKWGKIFTERELSNLCVDVSLLGTNDQAIGMTCKKSFGVRRYKVVDPMHTDKEIKEKGIEIIKLDEGVVGKVLGYQNIERFSLIDFEKPARGMEIGMMPAKLTQILVSLGVGVASKNDTESEADTLTIYDPFCGFGTTGFVANNLGYHFIGSDINITPAKQNLKWWETTDLYNEELFFTLFKHDVLEAFTKPFLENIDVVVTEGRLGPVMNSQHFQQSLKDGSIHEYISQISKIYTNFITHLTQKVGLKPLVFTYPQYVHYREDMSQETQNHCRGLGYSVEVLQEVYKRKGQQVARRILIVS